jgi:hypothetical protein
MLSDFEGKRMIANYFGHSGNDLKSGKLSSGMGGRFRPESTLSPIVHSLRCDNDLYDIRGIMICSRFRLET